jgi:hypothetical protein
MSEELTIGERFPELKATGWWCVIVPTLILLAITCICVLMGWK